MVEAEHAHQREVDDTDPDFLLNLAPDVTTTTAGGQQSHYVVSASLVDVGLRGRTMEPIEQQAMLYEQDIGVLLGDLRAFPRPASEQP